MSEQLRNVRGMSEALRRMEKLPKAIQKRILDPGLKLAAHKVKQRAKAGAPKDTGNLAKKIQIRKVRSTASSTRLEYIIGASKKGQPDTINGAGQWTRAIDRSAFYSDMVVKGFYVKIKGGKKFIKPNDYLTKAMDAVEPDLPDIFLGITNEVLDSVVKEL